MGATIMISHTVLACLVPLAAADLGFVGEAHGAGFHGSGFHGFGPHSLVVPLHRDVPVLLHEPAVNSYHEPVSFHSVPVHHEPPYHGLPVHHAPPPYHAAPHHVPGFLTVKHDDYGHSYVQYDYGYG